MNKQQLDIWIYSLTDALFDAVKERRRISAVPPFGETYTRTNESYIRAYVREFENAGGDRDLLEMHPGDRAQLLEIGKTLQKVVIIE